VIQFCSRLKMEVPEEWHIPLVVVWIQYTVIFINTFGVSLLLYGYALDVLMLFRESRGSLKNLCSEFNLLSRLSLLVYLLSDVITPLTDKCLSVWSLEDFFGNSFNSV
jgi:hypothetical protein